MRSYYSPSFELSGSLGNECLALARRICDFSSAFVGIHELGPRGTKLAACFAKDHSHSRLQSFLNNFQPRASDILAVLALWPQYAASILAGFWCSEFPVSIGV